MEYVSKPLIEKIGLDKAKILEEFYSCLKKGEKYSDTLEVIKVLFDVYSVGCNSQWVIPLTADAISSDYKDSYNNQHYTYEIMSNLEAIMR